MKRILVVQHVALEGPGLLSGALQQWGWELDLRIMEVPGTELPESLEGYRALLILGGPMGAYEEDRYPYLLRVEELIREGVEKAIPILGVCLGGQLIARALQAEVKPNAAREIGWYPIFLTPPGKASPLFAGFPDTFFVFQWHGDTFELPQGAVLLATGETCRNQAFLYGECALALQFHPEVTPDMIFSWTKAYAAELLEFGGPEFLAQVEEETQSWWQEGQTVREAFLRNLCLFLERGA